jgi:hypothetical protein
MASLFPVCLMRTWRRACDALTFRAVRRSLVAPVVAVLLLGCASASDPPGDAGFPGSRILMRLEGSGLAQILETLGFADVEVDEDGDLLLTMGGVRVLALLGSYGGEFLLLIAGFSEVSLTAEQVNDWNREYRFSKVYLDAEGDPVIEAELDLAGGVTLARVEDFLQTFAGGSLPRFVELLGAGTRALRPVSGPGRFDARTGS